MVYVLTPQRAKNSYLGEQQTSNEQVERTGRGMNKSHCLSGSTTCLAWKGRAVAAVPCSWAQIHCHVLAALLPTSPIMEKVDPFPLRLNCSLDTQLHYLHLDNKPRSSIQAICEGCEDKRGRGNSANPFDATFKTALWPESSSEHRRFQSLQRELCSDEYFGAMGQGKSWASTFMLGPWSTFL